MKSRRSSSPSSPGTARKYRQSAPRLSPRLRQLFLEYDWPGNIRELENMIKRLVILQDEQIAFAEIERSTRRVASAVPVPVSAEVADPGGSADVTADLAGGSVARPFASPEGEANGVEHPEGTSVSLAAVARAAAMKAERALIEKTLTQVHWNRRKASQILEVSYKTLLNKIKECSITRD